MATNSPSVASMPTPIACLSLHGAIPILRNFYTGYRNGSSVLDGLRQTRGLSRFRNRVQRITPDT